MANAAFLLREISRHSIFAKFIVYFQCIKCSQTRDHMDLRQLCMAGQNAASGGIEPPLGGVATDCGCALAIITKP
jgi:hypothetical protein